MVKNILFVLITLFTLLFAGCSGTDMELEEGVVLVDADDEFITDDLYVDSEGTVITDDIYVDPNGTVITEDVYVDPKGTIITEDIDVRNPDNLDDDYFDSDGSGAGDELGEFN